jgi:hypothetical protein
MLPDFDEHLACEFVRGLVRSAVGRRLDPAARLLQFRALQQTVVSITWDPALRRTAEQLVLAIDLRLQE